MKTYLLTAFIFLFCVQIGFSKVIILNGLTHSFSGNSGQTVQGQIVLANISNESQRVSFDLNEAIYSCEKERSFIKDVFHQNSASSWFDGAVMDKVLGPKEKYVYKYSFTIPEDVTLRGSFWTTLLVNVEKPIKEEVVNNIGLDTKIRYAVRLVVDVADSDEVNLEFQKVNISKNDLTSKKQLDVQIFNESLFAENVKLSAEVYDHNGVKVLDLKTNRSKVFPKVCRNFSIDVTSLSSGSYQCILIADSREEYTGTTLSLEIN